MDDTPEFIASFKRCTQSERQEKLELLETEAISDIVIEQALKKTDFASILWSSVCEIEDEKKLLPIVTDVLPKLNRDTLSLRQYQDFITRFLIQLQSKTLEYIHQICQLCTEFMAIGDQRAPFYKDILPLCLKLLQKAGARTLETEDGESITGKEAANDVVKGILRSDFAVSILTTLVSMFK
jgi:hypothetical protein